MLVCTLARSTASAGMAATASASVRALAWSSARRSTMRSSEMRPAAAMMPACRMPPPTILRTRRARSMKAAEPQTTEPTGAASPLDRQKVTESTGCGELPRVALERDRRVEQAGAVQVDRHPGRVGHRRHRGDLLGRAAGAPVAVVRVLQADETGGRDVDVGRTQRLLHLVGGEEAALGLHRAHLHVADDGGAGHLVVVDVRVEVEHDFLAGLGVGHDRDEVAHGAGGHEEAGLLAQARGGQPPPAAGRSDPRPRRRRRPRRAPWPRASRGSAASACRSGGRRCRARDLS